MTTDRPPTVDELLAAYADDPASLTAAERAAVEAHLAADAGAASELGELRGLLGELRAHGDVAAGGPPAAMEAAVRAALVPAPRRWRWAAGAGVALAAAAVLAVWWQRRGEPSELVARMQAALAATVAPAPGPGPDMESPRPDDVAVSPEDRGPAPREAPPGPRPEVRDPRPDEVAVSPEDRGPSPEDRGPSLEDRGPSPADAPADEALALALDLDERAAGEAAAALEDLAVDEGLLPDLDTAWLDDLSEAELEQAVAWLDEQGAG